MKKLKDITKSKALKTAGDAYIPDEPIHFKMGYGMPSKIKQAKFIQADSGDAYIPDEPVHFKHVSKLKEETEKKKPVNGWIEHNQNKHLGAKSHDISKQLTHHLKTHHDLNTDEYYHAQKYTDTSRDLNRELINSHKDKKEPHRYWHQTVHHLDSATKRPIGHHVHLYSGLGFDPHSIKNKNGHVHLPAYTSLTHDKRKAHSFAHDHYHGDEIHQHILHVHMKKKDKGLHVSHFSHYPEEHETILPRNTKIKIHKKPSIYHEWGGRKVHVWHAHIIHQD